MNQQTDKRERVWSDRRTAFRLKYPLSVKIRVEEPEESRGGPANPAKLLDISKGGIKLISSREIKSGQKITINMDDGGIAASELSGIVVWDYSVEGPSEFESFQFNGDGTGDFRFVYGVRFHPLGMDRIKEVGRFLDAQISSRHTRKFNVERRRYDYFDEWLARLNEKGAGYEPWIAESSPTPRVIYNQKEVIQLCSNNGLGMSTHARVISAARAALEKYGTGCGGSRLVSGNLIVQKELEQKVANFMGYQDAIVFMTGYMGNVGVLEALSNIGDVNHIPNKENVVALFTDHQNHRSITHGCQLAYIRNQAVVRSYRHLDMNQLEDHLKSTHTSRKVIVSEGLFSMTGDLCPLRDIVALARKYNAIVYLDDAHAIGYLGETGRGSIEHWGVRGLDVILGTFSKAFGAAGGFIVARNSLCQYLRLQANTYIFSSALPPATSAGVMEAIDLIDHEPFIRESFWENVRYFQNGLRRLGFDTLGTQSHITPVFIGPEDKAIRIAEKLFEKNIFIPAIRWPAVPPGEAMLRCMVMAQHTKEQLNYVIEELGKSGREEGII